MHPSSVLAKLRSQREANEAAVASGHASGGLCQHVGAKRATIYAGVPMHVLICENCGSIGPSESSPTVGEWTPPRLFAATLRGGAPARAPQLPEGPVLAPQVIRPHTPTATARPPLSVVQSTPGGAPDLASATARARAAGLIADEPAPPVEGELEDLVEGVDVSVEPREGEPSIHEFLEGEYKHWLADRRRRT